MDRSLLIVDLEATCWDRPEHRPELMETIEIGAVLVDPTGRDPDREFQSFVRPVRTTALSAFCTELTSIRQEDVDRAETFPSVLERFLEWMGGADEVLFASWGFYDRKQIAQDCAFHRLPYPFGEDHLNVKREVSRKLGARPAGLGQVVSRLGLGFDGTHHRGIDDARNIRRVVAHVWGADLSSWLATR